MRPSTHAADRIAIATLAGDGRLLYAAAAGGPGRLAIYRSGDGGNSWTALRRFPNDGYPGYKQCLYLVINPSRPSTVYLGGAAPLVSFDGGNKWYVPAEYIHVDQHTLVIARDGTQYLGNDGGVLRSTSHGASWTKANGGLVGIEAYSVATTWPRQPFGLYEGIQDDGLVQYKGHGSWEVTPAEGDAGPTIVDPHDSHTVYTAGVPGPFVIFRHDVGHYQYRVDPLHGPPEAVYPGILAVDPERPGRLLMAGTRLWESTDGASHWHVAGRGQELTTGSVMALALAPTALKGVGKVDEMNRKRRASWQDGSTNTHLQEMPDALPRRILSDARDA